MEVDEVAAAPSDLNLPQPAALLLPRTETTIHDAASAQRAGAPLAPSIALAVPPPLLQKEEEEEEPLSSAPQPLPSTPVRPSRSAVPTSDRVLRKRHKPATTVNIEQPVATSCNVAVAQCQAEEEEPLSSAPQPLPSTPVRPSRSAVPTSDRVLRKRKRCSMATAA
jgi:hypothetical protein